MFENLTKALKGKKLMECPMSERDKMKGEIEKTLDDVMKFLGASGMVIYLINDDKQVYDSATAYQSFKGVSAADLIPLYQNVSDFVTRGFEPETLISLASAVQFKSSQKTSGEPVNLNGISSAMAKALSELPGDTQAQIVDSLMEQLEGQISDSDMSKIEKLRDKALGIKKKSKKQDDDLLDDLLK